MDCKREGCEQKALDWKVCAQCFLSRYCSEECLIVDWEENHEESCPGHMFNLKDLVPMKKYLRKLGQGTYSEVQLVQHKESRKYFALKIINKSILSRILPIETLFREISLHKSLIHDNIIQLFDQLEDKSRIYLVLEHASKCNLYQYLEIKKRISEPEACKMFVDICLGVNYMHEKGIMHRDLKAENMLLTEENQVKICDLGWSAYCDKPRNTFCGTLDYMSPEILQGNKYSFPSDIWSLGVLLYEMLHGKSPFSSSDSEKIQQILDKDFRFDTDLSPAASGLIKKILAYEPSQRPNILEILKDRWVQQHCKSDVSIGSKILHNDFDIGSVVFIKGLVCKVEFPIGTFEFIIPEMLKNCSLIPDNYEDLSVELLRNAIGRNVSPICKNNFEEKPWKLQESFSIIETSTMSGEGFLSDLSEFSEVSFRVSDRQKELNQLQAILEVVENEPQREYHKSKTFLDSLVNVTGCVKR